MKIVSVALILLASTFAFAETDVLKDFDSLGGNDVLLDKARALNPESRVQVVQKRIVNRFKRHEFAPDYGVVTGGNSYLNTQVTALNYNFHINPHWSVGLRYSHFFNQLSEEGRKVVAKAEEAVETGNEQDVTVPELNWMKNSYLLQANWYPIYGKLNVFDMGVVHFDIYALLGAGSVELRNNESNLYVGGLGIGFWISQHLTTRFEYRYQNYEVESYAGTKNLGVNSASLSMGYML